MQQAIWDELKPQGVVTVAAALGGPQPSRRRDNDCDPQRAGIGPCPACGAPKRHPKRGDWRGAVGLRRDGLGWLCHQCDVSGDAVTMAAWIVLGKAKPDGRAEWAELRQRCEAVGLVGPHAKPPPPRSAPPGPRYPDPAELAKVWDSCVDVDQDTEASLWLRRRPVPLDPGRVVDLCDVRVVNSGAELPGWARFNGEPWTVSGHRLIAKLYDAGGRWRSVHARGLQAGAKGAFPRGFSGSGLVLADALAARLLAGDPAAAAYVQEASRGDHGCGVVIVEGLPDWICEQASYSDADASAPAVVGMMSGSWKHEHAARVPNGCTVRIATDDDKAGDEYAASIAATFQSRGVKLRRWRDPGVAQSATQKQHNKEKP